jgi:hypothetical protein
LGIRLLLLSVRTKKSLERIEAPGPEALIKREPRLRIGEWAGLKPAAVRATADSPMNESGALKYADVLGGGRERHRQRLRQFGDGPLSIGKTAKHVSPCRIGKRTEDAIQHARIGGRTSPTSHLLLFNHMVYNIFVIRNSQPAGLRISPSKDFWELHESSARLFKTCLGNV